MLRDLQNDVRSGSILHEGKSSLGGYIIRLFPTLHGLLWTNYANTIKKSCLAIFPSTLAINC